MSWLIFAAAVALFVIFWWLVFDADIKASVHRDLRDKHRHDYQWVGYGGAGWSLYQCACGAKEIDA